MTDASENPSPTAFTENNLSKGLCGLSWSETTTYSWIKQYMAMVTDIETITTIWKRDQRHAVRFMGNDSRRDDPTQETRKLHNKGPCIQG